MSEKSSQDWIKIILLGESGVGKTNLINAITGKDFDLNTRSSLTSSYTKGVISIGDKEHTYILWDTAGQENYRSLNKIFIKNSKIVIFVYSIDNYDSFKELDYWIETVQNELEGGEFLSAIVGNKFDLLDKQVVSDEDAENYAKKHNMKFKYTSALADQIGFKNFVDELIRDYIKTLSPQDNKNKNGKNNSIVLNPEKAKNKNNRKCCN